LYGVATRLRHVDEEKAVGYGNQCGLGRV
jgi:hypothetical protein